MLLGAIQQIGTSVEGALSAIQAHALVSSRLETRFRDDFRTFLDEFVSDLPQA
jgi:hypothetical protein